MKASVKSTKTITLELSEEEAAWLKDVVQNPVHGNSSKEDPGNALMRQQFWHALNNALLP